MEQVKESKSVKTWAILMLLSLILAGSTACNPFAGKEMEPAQELVEVVQGNLTITVSGSGNIEIAKEAKLSFGVSGRVDRIYVKEGDEVNQGQVLATLETDALELALSEAEISDTQAQIAVTRAEVAITQAELSITQAQTALRTAELELERAQNTYKWPALEVAQADVEMARLSLKNAQDRFAEAPPEDKENWAKLVASAQANLIIHGDRLNAMLSSADTKEVAIKKLQVEAAKKSLELAEQSLKLAKQSLELNRQSLLLAEQSLKQARKQLDEATLTAPLASVVAEIRVKEKDSVTPAIKIIHLIDLSSMELKVQVDEIEIPEVKPGQRAIITVDAQPTFPLEGKVSSISLLPKIEGGVTSYDIRIDFAVPAGALLRAGMSATTDIIIAQRSNVLLVPDRAINRDSQGNSGVEVMANGEIEQRAVVTGLSDGFQTEIVEGLNKGEKVVIEKKTKPKEGGFLFS